MWLCPAAREAGKFHPPLFPDGEERIGEQDMGKHLTCVLQRHLRSMQYGHRGQLMYISEIYFIQNQWAAIGLWFVILHQKNTFKVYAHVQSQRTKFTISFKKNTMKQRNYNAEALTRHLQARVQGPKIIHKTFSAFFLKNRHICIIRFSLGIHDLFYKQVLRAQSIPALCWVLEI